MHQIIGGRGTGKTLQLMLIAKETDAVIVCADPKALKAKAEMYGFGNDLKFINYNDFLYRSLGTREKYLIDEVDGLFRTIHPFVVGYSISKED